MAQDKTSNDFITEIPSAHSELAAPSSGVKHIQLKNRLGVTAEFINWGARLTKLWVPDRNGNLRNILLAYPSHQDYLDDPFYLGALVGPYANRIASGHIQARGLDIRLPVDEGGQHLHGGMAGFESQFWQVDTQDALSVRFKLQQPDGYGGYPGNRHFVAEFRLAEDEARLDLTIWADSDCLSPYGVSQHSYFNLDGTELETPLQETALRGHTFRIPATHYLPVDERQIPYSGVAPVVSTPMDLQSLTNVREHLESALDHDSQVQPARGFDHCWCFDRLDGSNELSLNGEAFSDISGIRMRIYSDQPGMQFYTGQWLSLFESRHGDRLGFNPMQGFCMEPQQFPNGPNRDDCPDAWLEPNATSVSRIQWVFDSIQ